MVVVGLVMVVLVGLVCWRNVVVVVGVQWLWMSMLRWLVRGRYGGVLRVGSPSVVESGH